MCYVKAFCILYRSYKVVTEKTVGGITLSMWRDRVSRCEGDDELLFPWRELSVIELELQGNGRAFTSHA